MSERILVSILLLLLVFSFASCSGSGAVQPEASPAAGPADLPEAGAAPSPEETGGESETILYENPDFGIALEFPAHWKDKYVVEVVDDELVVYAKNTMEWGAGRGNSHPFGELFTIARTEEDLSEEDLINFDFRSRILLKAGGYTYYQKKGSGYEGPWPREEHPELYEEYMQMFKEGEAALDSIRACEP